MSVLTEGLQLVANVNIAINTYEIHTSDAASEPDLESSDPKGRAGSCPAPGTNKTVALIYVPAFSRNLRFAEPHASVRSNSVDSCNERQMFRRSRMERKE